MTDKELINEVECLYGDGERARKLSELWYSTKGKSCRQSKFVALAVFENFTDREIDLFLLKTTK